MSTSDEVVIIQRKIPNGYFFNCFQFLIFEFQRIELQKFAKLMRQRRPNSKLSMQYDKLIIDHEIYMFNDITGRVEEVRFRLIFFS